MSVSQLADFIVMIGISAIVGFELQSVGWGVATYGVLVILTNAIKDGR